MKKEDKKVEDYFEIENKKEFTKSKKFYISGFVLVGLSLLAFIGLIIAVTLNPIDDIGSSWYMFVILGLAIVFFIIGYILLRKGNKIRINEVKRDDEETKKIIEQKIKELEESKRKENKEK